MATSNVNQPFNPNPGAGMHQRPDDIHIQPHPHPHGMGMGADGHAQPIPIQLPNIYVNPFPAQDHTRDRDTTPGTRHVHREGEPINVPTSSTTHGHSRRSGSGTIKIGSWRFTKPHPLLWVCLGLSILALVLEVPKGSLPTLTGRHRALRAQEKLLTQRLHLIAHLSHFLAPPLSTLIAPSTPSDPATSLLALNDRNQLELIHSAGLRFWNTQSGNTMVGAGNDDRWWSVEDLGEGASLVRSKSEGREREVWVLRMGDSSERDRPLVNALTHSLLLRDKLSNELESARSSGGGIIGGNASSDQRPSIDNTRTPAGSVSPNANDIAHRRQEEEVLRREQARLEELRRREREREREVEEREREVARREKWVVDEMRKLSDKVHAQATELTLEDRITERLKSYQRELAHLRGESGAERVGASGSGAGVGSGAGAGAGVGTGNSAGLGGSFAAPGGRTGAIHNDL